MKLNAKDLKRIELLPENEEDKKVIGIILARERVIRQVLNTSQPLIYWGDSDEDGGRGGLIISTYVVPSNVLATVPEGHETAPGGVEK